MTREEDMEEMERGPRVGELLSDPAVLPVEELSREDGQ